MKKIRMKRSIALAVMMGIFSSISIAQMKGRDVGLSPQARAKVRQAMAAVGLIQVVGSSDAVPRPRGSGVVVRSDGLVVTNNHVITEPRTNRLFSDIFFSFSDDGAAASESKRYRLKAVLLNRDHDLALLRIVNGGDLMVFPTIEIGDSQSVRMLDDLTVIGFPEKGGTTVTISRGVVEGRDVLGNWIKTDARVIHGNSGGAAVSSEGKLIGIPTKVVADSQPIDKNGDGFPDDYKVYGAVGFLRPAHLVAAMLAQIDRGNGSEAAAIQAPPQVMPSVVSMTVRGTVRSAVNSRPVAGALVGLLQTGTQTVTASSLLAWGNTNPEGQFTLNKQIPAGKYTVRVKALGYKHYSREVEIDQKTQQIIIELSLPDKQ
jgi:S1-C subfamily serine protease